MKELEGGIENEHSELKQRRRDQGSGLEGSQQNILCVRTDDWKQ